MAQTDTHTDGHGGCMIFLNKKKIWGGIYFISFFEGGSTNERPGTDHVISGPMRGLKKTAPMAQTETQTDMATL